jgi:hypothetical protein
VRFGGEGRDDTIVFIVFLIKSMNDQLNRNRPYGSDCYPLPLASMCPTIQMNYFAVDKLSGLHIKRKRRPETVLTNSGIGYAA